MVCKVVEIDERTRVLITAHLLVIRVHSYDMKVSGAKRRTAQALLTGEEIT